MVFIRIQQILSFFDVFNPDATLLWFYHIFSSGNRVLGAEAELVSGILNVDLYSSQAFPDSVFKTFFGKRKQLEGCNDYSFKLAFDIKNDFCNILVDSFPLQSHISSDAVSYTHLTLPTNREV